VAVCGTVGSILGGAGAEALAAKLGASEDVQKLAGLAGSLLGGWAGGKGGGLLGKVEPIANLERGVMRPVLENAPGYREDLAGMKGASPSQIEARTQIAEGQTPGSQAALAAGQQGSTLYPGQDPLKNTQYQAGDRFVGGIGKDGKPTGWLVREEDYNNFVKNGGTRDDYWQGLQVKPGPDRFVTDDNPNAYRNDVKVFEAQAPGDAAAGPTVANTKYGPGGIPQSYISDTSNLVEVGTNTLPSTPGAQPLTGYTGPGGTVGAGVGGSQAGVVDDGGQKPDRGP
jgi:hypothetical protein